MQHISESYKTWQNIVRRFPKDLRYTLGAKITSLFLELLEEIFRARITSLPQKLQKIENASLKLDLLKFFLQIAWEDRALDTQKYALLSEQIARVGRMLGGWRKQSASRAQQ